MKRYPVPAAWAGDIDQFSLALCAAQASAQTIETRTEHLRRFARQTGAPSPALVSRARLVEWAGSQTWAAETRRSHYATLRRFYGWALETGRVAEDITDALPVIAPGPALPRPASEDTYRDALERVDARTHVILRLAAEAGLRRAEIAQIERSDLLSDLDGISLLVHGKGAKDRLVPLSDSLAREVTAMLGRGRWLLPSPTGGHLTARHVGKLASKALPNGVTLHMLRHRFASRIYAQTPDLRAIQTLLGHSSVATTQRYTAVSDDALRRAVSLAAV